MNVSPGRLVLFAISAGFAGYGAWRYWRAARTATWLSTPGQIVESGCESETDGDGQDEYRATVRYSYSAGGTVHFGDRITLGDTATRFRSSAERLAARYPTGQNVIVYYDPQDPGNSALERKAGGAAWAMVLGAVFFFLLGWLAPDE